MMSIRSESNILLIGQVTVDVTLPAGPDEPKLRFGGIMHAARALWAIGCNYGLAYMAPDYLDESIHEYASKFGAKFTCKIGSVVGSPNVLLIREAKECGPQGYEYLLRDEHQVTMHIARLQVAMEETPWSDVLVFSGGYDLSPVLGVLSQYAAQVDVDANFETSDWSTLSVLSRPINTLILSTSSRMFTSDLQGNVEALVGAVKQSGADFLLFKENRGGSRFFDLKKPDIMVQTPAQARLIAHSVGVGDCFNAVFAACRSETCYEEALAYASCVASEYAATTYPEDFAKAAQAWMQVPPREVAELKGVALCWEDRPACQLYIAAPDFDFVDTRPVDTLCESLRYHNFSPRLPVREHGQLGDNPSPSRKSDLYHADMTLLHECGVLIAVLLYKDPGTLIEIGMARGTGKAVIVYDPYSIAKNLVLTEAPRLVSSDLDEIILHIFKAVQEWRQQ